MINKCCNGQKTTLSTKTFFSPFVLTWQSHRCVFDTKRVWGCIDSWVCIISVCPCLFFFSMRLLSMFLKLRRVAMETGIHVVKRKWQKKETWLSGDTLSPQGLRLKEQDCCSHLFLFTEIYFDLWNNKTANLHKQDFCCANKNKIIKT